MNRHTLIWGATKAKQWADHDISQQGLLPLVGRCLLSWPACRAARYALAERHFDLLLEPFAAECGIAVGRAADLHE
ncbi:MAG: hypothetical protein WCF44_04735 [Candidatus Methylophosphatis roskildensis]